MALIDLRQNSANGAATGLAPEGLLAMLGGEKHDHDEEAEKKPADKSDSEKENELDEELDESFPASDPPSQTQP